MNVTNDEFKDRQFQSESYLQMVSAEQKEYAEVSAHQRIAENNNTITDFQTDKLLDKILQPYNLNKTYKKVKSNKCAGGIDGTDLQTVNNHIIGNINLNKKFNLKVRTTRKTGGLHCSYKPLLLDQRLKTPGFHFVQATPFVTCYP